MSLSEICVQQHEHEQKKLKRFLLWGLLGSLGAHGVGLSLSQFNLGQAATNELMPIELIVTDSLTEPLPDEPEVLPDPTQPAELSTQTNDPAAATASAPPQAAVVAPPATAPPPSRVGRVGHPQQPRTAGGHPGRIGPGRTPAHGRERAHPRRI